MKWCTHKATSLSRSDCAENAASPSKNQITTSQFRKMADSQRDGSSEIKNMSNSMFEHVTKQAHHEMRQDGGLVFEKGSSQEVSCTIESKDLSNFGM